jgi:RNA polymerase sigma-70 factor (ECF subfamily)
LAPGRQAAAPVNGQTGAAPAGDSELVRRAVVELKRGDRSALQFLYVRYADEVSRYARSIVRDEHEAEDITHTVFAKLLAAIRHYEPRDVPFAAWIMRVARNAALDHLRARRQIPCEEIRTLDEGYELAAGYRSKSLCEAFRRLPHDQREVLVLRHIAGLSPGEIASRIGKSESAVHGLHHRGRGAMQAALRELDVTPTVAG